MESMEFAYLQSAKYSINAEFQLKNILGAFNEQGIDVLVLKGIAYANAIYSDPASRPYTDIDLMVKPGDFLRSRNAMSRMGYTPVKRNFDISKNWFIEETFTNKNNPKSMMADIHWDLQPFSNLGKADIDRVFNEAIAVKSANISFKTLDTSDSILLSAIHLGLNHSSDVRLSWILDIALLCSRLNTQDKWDALILRSVDYGASLALRNTLLMARYWTRLKVPYGYDDFTKWPEPSEGEVMLYPYAINRRSSIVNVIKLKWPKNASLSEKANILYHLITVSL